MKHTLCRIVSQPSVPAFSHLYSDHSLYISGHLATNHQMAPRPRDRPRNHLKATRKEPDTPSSGSRMHRSNRQGEPPAHTESREPSGQKVFSTPSMDPSGHTAETPSTQSELGGTSAGHAWQAREPRGRQTRMTSPHCPRAVRISPKGWSLSRWRQKLHPLPLLSAHTSVLR
jgi:hypothetical protein